MRSPARAPFGGARSRRVRLTAVTFAAAAALVATGLPANAAASGGESHAGWHDVVVTGSGAPAAAAAVTAAGGRVLTDLPMINGVAASLAPGAKLGPMWLVAPQRAVSVAAAPADQDAPAATVRRTLGLAADGDEGRGTTVAVVDTGIADVPDLAGRVSDRVDLTGSGAGDGYGHGTFMAGLIAGSGAGSDGAYRGVAPGARLVDVKVADADGNTDLITVLRGLQWASRHSRDIDVLNLSLSSYSPLPYQVDPLTQALEALWHDGMTVVVPAGNEGSNEGSVTSPGTDPVLLTAGGLDESGTAARGDDTVAPWSGRGPTWQGDAKPDLVAPGARLIGLRAAGSRIDTANAQARVGSDYFRGSGTSMSTAVTSGVAAAALAVQPRLRPDAIKTLLTSTAYAGTALTGGGTSGAGGLDAAGALAAAPGWQTTESQTEYDRDTAVIRGNAKAWAAFEQALLRNDRTAAATAWKRLSPQSRQWAGRAWAQLDPATRAWAGRAWAGRAWASGADGTAADWAGRAWAGRAWAGRAWADASFTGRAWAGRAWADADWAGRTWSGRAWADSDWAGRAWAGRAWADSDWTGRAWAGRTWSGRTWSGRASAEQEWVDGEWTGRAWASEGWSARAWAWLP